MVSAAISLAVRPACSLASALRWCRVGATTCSMNEISRSTAALTTRRCRASTPCRPSAAAADATWSASRPYARPTRRTSPNVSSSASCFSLMPAAVEQLAAAQRGLAGHGRGIAGRGRAEPGGVAAPSGGGSRSLITRSGRYWSRCAVRM